MPPEAVAPNPVAPAAAAPKAAAPALPNAPKVEIPVSQMKPKENQPPPKKGSARERLMQDLEKKAVQEPGTERKPPAEVKETDDVQDPDQKAKNELERSPEKSGDTPPEEIEKAGDKAKTKVNPWKLVEEHKEARAKAEAKILELEKRAIPEEKWKEKESEVERIRKQNEELEQEIKFVNYSKSAEFQEKYQKPYVQAWENAMSEVSELIVGDGSDQRPMNAQDLLDIVNMPLGKAIEYADENFGESAASVVLAHRKEIKKLFDEQSNALERAKKDGVDRDTSMSNSRKEMGSKILETWSKANDEIAADPKYGKFFTPVEGDENINQRLAKGFQLADRAFNENPTNPKLTPEERASVVKRHAAVRNRAAAFGRLVYENGIKEARIAELEKIVAEYKGSEPDTTGSKPELRPQGKATMTGVLEELRKRAK